MRHSTCSRVVFTVGRITVLGMVLMVCSSSLFSTTRRPSKIFCREDLSQARRQAIADKLRTITGWNELAFDRDGSLQLGAKSATEGSPSARALLERAMSGSAVVVIEDASNRQDVVFCRVVPARWSNTSEQNPPAYVVLVDFADFDHLIGDKIALKAFDVGWGFLHEIDHVVNDSVDAETLDDAGECESHINQMRRECDLPVRSQYFSTLFPHAEQSDFMTRFVRLAFDHEDTGTSKHRRYWVMWDATVVGGMTPTNLIAEFNR